MIFLSLFSLNLLRCSKFDRSFIYNIHHSNFLDPQLINKQWTVEIRKKAVGKHMSLITLQAFSLAPCRSLWHPGLSLNTQTVDKRQYKGKSRHLSFITIHYLVEDLWEVCRLQVPHWIHKGYQGGLSIPGNSLVGKSYER